MREFLRTSLWCALSSAALGLPAVAQAQLAAAQIQPDAGQALRSLEQKPPAQPAPDDVELTQPATPAPADADADGGMPIEIKSFVIDGNSVIDTAQLQALLKPLEGQSLTLSQLQAGIAPITELYRERGYPFAYAYLPAQTVDEGILRVSVLEGRLGAVQIDNQSRQKNWVVEQQLRRLQIGDVMRGDSLETSLLLLNDVPGVHAQSSLQPGVTVGTSDLVVTVQDQPMVSGALGLDNFGNLYTGEYRGSVGMQLNGALGLGEQIQLQTVLSNEQLRNYRLGYQMPLGPWNTQVGASTSRLTYTLGDIFSVLDKYGSALVSSLYASQPLVRSRSMSLNAKLQYEQKRLADHTGAYDLQERKRVNVTTLSLDGSWHDSFGGRAVNQWSLDWQHGHLSLGTEDQRERDDRDLGSAGNFQVWSANWSRWQALSGPWSLYGRLNGQYASKNLDSSEKMSLGGAYGVRAYPQGEASGDHGLQGSLELRYAFGNAWQLSSFIDMGRVKQQHSPRAQAMSEKSGRTLAGVGLGVQRHGATWSLDSSLAWKVSRSDATSGPERSPRLWLNAKRYF